MVNDLDVCNINTGNIIVCIIENDIRLMKYYCFAASYNLSLLHKL